MKTILLAAKSEAIDTFRKEIEIDHIHTALCCVEIEDEKKRDLLYSTFKFSVSNANMEQCISQDAIDDAMKHPKILYTEEVKDLIEVLEKEGIDFSTKLSSPLPEDCGDNSLFDEVVDFFGDIVDDDKPSPSKDILDQARNIRTNLSKYLFGQDRAVGIIIDSIKNDLLPSQSAPKATYLFLGPPATGKTYLSELMGEYMEGYEGKVKVFDMTQFSHAESGGDLYGTARMWGNTRNGQLTSFVKDNPKSIIVLDEFEKANNQVQSNLLSIFSSGKMKDVSGWCPHKGKEVPYGSLDDDNNEVKCSNSEVIDMIDFTQTIFIITSNLGKELYGDPRFVDLIKENHIQAESMFMDALRRETKQDNKSGGEQPAIMPELVSRFSQANIVLFDRLTYKAFAKIAKHTFSQYIKGFKKTYEIEFIVDETYDDFIKVQLLKYAPEMDARRVKSKMGRDFFDQISDYLMTREEKLHDCKEIHCSFSKKSLAFIKKSINPKIDTDSLVKELFRKNMTLKIDASMKKDDEIITYTINSIKFERVVRIKDFSGDEGLVFDIPDTSFKMIAGHEQIKSRLLEIAHFLKDPKKLKAYGTDIPKGMLLYGPPGTGKTMLAKAFANEADLPFMETTGTQLLNLEHIKKIFAKAKEYAPSIIFIDEIDGIGRREDNNGRDPFINQILSEMKGFSDDPDAMVFVIAATNHKHKIDSAILRPGRLDLHVSVGNLDRDAREYFINKILKKPTVGEFDIKKLLMYTAGMSGADLDKLGRESAHYVIRHGGKGITQEILIEQINIIKYGERLNNKKLEDSLAETAIHEAGHAILSKVLMPEVKIEQITITPRDRSLGFVSFDPESAQGNMTIGDIRNKMAISMAGRLSQIKKFGKEEGTDNGASSDLQQATRMAYIAIAYYGMDEELGYFNIDGIPNLQKSQTGISNSLVMQDIINKRVQVWLKEEQERTVKLIDEQWEQIEKLSELLLEDEVVYENSVLEILK